MTRSEEIGSILKLRALLRTRPDVELDMIASLNAVLAGHKLGPLPHNQPLIFAEHDEIPLQAARDYSSENWLQFKQISSADIDTTCIFPEIQIRRSVITQAVCNQVIELAEAKQDWRKGRVATYKNNIISNVELDLQSRNVDICSAHDLPISTLNSAISQSYIGFEGLPSGTLFHSSDIIISKYSIGSRISAHRDTGPRSTKRLATSLVGLNSDYSGGRVAFPQLCLVVRIEKGDCITFNSELLHEVEEISAGVRYSAMAFCIGNGF